MVRSWLIGLGVLGVVCCAGPATDEERMVEEIERELRKSLEGCRHPTSEPEHEASERCAWASPCPAGCVSVVQGTSYETCGTIVHIQFCVKDPRSHESPMSEE